MSYVKNLAADEEVLLKARRTKLIFTDSVLLSIAYIAYVICFFAFDWLDSADTPARLLAAFGPAIIPVGLLIKDFLGYIDLEVGLTPTRLLGKKGIIRLLILDHPLNRATNMKVEISLLGRIFKFGTLRIFAPGVEYVYKMIRNPLAIQAMVNRLSMQNQNAANTFGGNTPQQPQ
ncbi:MAG: PH domain-containing protein [Firmicutes bacterium]|nr:PH domain-containing protein [Bacillota bacterium]